MSGLTESALHNIINHCSEGFHSNGVSSFLDSSSASALFLPGKCVAEIHISLDMARSHISLAT